MVTLEKALLHIGRPYNVDKGKEIAIKRLMLEDTISLNSRFAEEHPIDMLIPLLEDGSPKEVREGVLEGLKEIYSKAYEWLNSKQSVNYKYIESLCRITEIAEPPELENEIKKLLQKAIDNNLPINDYELTYTILSAKYSYPITKEELPIIEYFIKDEKFVAISFRRLIESNPIDLQIEKHLFELWCKRYEENWEVNASFLAVELMEKKGRNDIVINVLKKIYKEHQQIWFKVKDELKNLSEDLLEEFPISEWLSKVDY